MKLLEPFLPTPTSLLTRISWVLEKFNQRSEVERPLRGRDQVRLFFENEIVNVRNMNPIMQNKLVLHMLFSQQSQIEFFNKHKIYIKNFY